MDEPLQHLTLSQEEREMPRKREMEKEGERSAAHQPFDDLHQRERGHQYLFLDIKYT